MRHRLLSLACAAVLAAGAAKGQPVAGEAPPPGAADCIWAGVPADIRKAVAAAATVEAVSEAMAPFDSDHQQQIDLAVKCGVPADGDPAEVAKQVIVPKTMEIWSAGRLKTDFGV